MSLRPILPAALAAWLGYLAADFLTHAVILASYWRETEDYWLPPMEMFRRIPFGYGSFAVYCLALTWLLARLYGEQVTLPVGLRFGLVAGVTFGLTTALGTYSLLRLPLSYFVVAPTTTALESTVVGGLAAWVLRGERRWRRVGLVLAVAVLLFAVGVLIQTAILPPPEDRLVPM